MQNYSKRSHFFFTEEVRQTIYMKFQDFLFSEK